MYILHGIDDWGSQVIHMALQVIGAPFSYLRLDFDAGDLQQPDYLARNPFGRIPLLETPDGAIYETAAILTYLADLHPGLAPLPSDKDWAQFLMLYTLTTNSLHPLTMFLVHPYRMAGEDCKAAASKSTRVTLTDLLAHFDAKAGMGYWWLGSERPSILSLYVVMLLRWVQCFAHIPGDNISLTAYPNLLALARGIESHPAVRKTLIAEGLTGPALSAAG
jgi:glutathione S-transferase